jgi:2-polyprenyl-6-methoxyphenol hydroxylase-like FAD-dependent oxidoreductase
MVEADLLVGADGLHSGVRALAFGPQQRFWVALDNILVAAFLPQRPPDSVDEHTPAMVTAPGRTAVVASLGAGRSAALLTYRSTDPPAIWPTGRTRRSPAPHRDSGWLLPELLDQLGQAGSVYFDSATQVRADHWSLHAERVLGARLAAATLVSPPPPPLAQPVSREPPPAAASTG